MKDLRFWKGLSVLLLACFAVTWFCCQLNHRLYQHQHPFDDSMSYHMTLYHVMRASGEGQFSEAVERACFSNTTNCLPFLMAIPAGIFSEPSRAVGSWIQFVFLFWFQASLLYYLLTVRKTTLFTAIMGCVVFLGLKCLLVPNGGLSDFRMDLGLYLLFASTSGWFLTSMAIPTRSHFLMLGISAGMCCLVRATAPIYLLVTFLPLLVLHLAVSRSRKPLIVGAGLAILVSAVVAGWFFVLNFEFLKFYYTEWNTDANAKLPMIESLKHFDYAINAIGNLTWVLIAGWSLFLAIASWHRESVVAWTIRAWRTRELDWQLAWIGVAPILLLVIRRAGFNPFVVMPAVFGIVLLAILPLLKQMDHLQSFKVKAACALILMCWLAFSFHKGAERHAIHSDSNTMVAGHEILNLILQDAKENQIEEVRFGVAQLSELNTRSLMTTLVFDRNSHPLEDYLVRDEGVEIGPIKTFNIAAKADWRRVSGDSDRLKVKTLLTDAKQTADYVVVPTKTTIAYLESTQKKNYLNRYLDEVVEGIRVDPSWTKVAGQIQFNEQQVVEVYRNNRVAKLETVTALIETP